MTHVDLHAQLASLATLRTRAVRMHGKAVSNVLALGLPLDCDAVATCNETLRRNLAHIERVERRIHSMLAEDAQLMAVYTV